MTNTPRDGAEHWKANEPPPSNFDQAAYQKRIDEIVGTRDGRPIVKLAWAPHEFRWMPHAQGDEPPGYTFPIFYAYTNTEGELIAAPRWVLMERLEWPQYGTTWEALRYTIEKKRYGFAINHETGKYLKDSFGNPILIHESGDDRLWDWKGPCPPERYVELWCHCYHDGICCPCIKYGVCECGVQYEHCWGKYLDPNERLLDWIRIRAWEARRDSDVKPDADIRTFEAPNAQREVKNEKEKQQEQRQEEAIRFNNSLLSHWQRKPQSGIILSN